MGNPKLKWTAEEEEALRAGVEKHGTGKWKLILVDSDFAKKLANRSNVDLKDKWRNMGPNCGQSCGTNSATPKVKAALTSAETPKTENSPSIHVFKDNVNSGQSGGTKAMTPKGKATVTNAVTPKTENSASIYSSKDNAKFNHKPDPSPQDVENAPDYNKIILEALSSINDRNGTDFGAILGFIEKKHEVQHNFRRLLSSKLRRLVLNGTLEKVKKRYKIKDAALGTKTPTPEQKAVRSIEEPKLITRAETVKDAAETAAKMIAEAEHRSFMAAEAVKESERISQMADEADAVLMRVKEIFEQWDDKGDDTSSKSSPAEVTPKV